jgi:aspartyl-tRNA(Asn)/glutamyl-tRNA(Gln) amidotransferase subunit A
VTNELIELSASEAIDRLRGRQLSPGELFDAYRERIDRLDGELGCFLLEADASDEAAAVGPLAGVPVAVKDLFCTEDVPTTAGSRILEGHRPSYSATAVRNLTEAGARIIGKTNMDEFAMGSSNENSAYGPVRNPWDRGRVPGGSSGGSAAAVAAGLAPWAIGTDTGGSIRQPAALCGIVGLKPTYGAVSRYGMVAFASSLDQCGPLARDVTDAALLLRHLVGRDPCDSTSLGLPEEVKLPSRSDLRGLRFGVPAELSSEAEGVEAGVRDVFDRTLGVIEGLGGELVQVGLPHAPHGIAAYYVIAPAEASANLARYDGVRYGLRAGNGSLLDLYEETRAAGFGAEVKRRIMLGTFALSAGYYEAYYGRAQRVRTKIADDFRTAFEQCDFIVTPTSPTVAFELGARTDDPLAMYLSDYCTVPMPLAGIPAISIPAGLASPDGEQADGGQARRRVRKGTGLPVGFQLAGPAFSENGILDAAFALEQALEFDVKGAFDE